MKSLLPALLAVLALVPHPARSAGSSPPSLVTAQRTVETFPLLDVFVRVCVIPDGIEGARAAVKAFGGKPIPAPQAPPTGEKPESYGWDIGGVPGNVTFDAMGTCLVGVDAADAAAVAAQFDAALKTLQMAPEPMTDVPPPGATFVRNVRVVPFPQSEFAMRLRVTSLPRAGRPTTVFLMHQLEPRGPDAPPPPPPPPPAPGDDYVPSSDLTGLANSPPRYPEAAVAQCASGLVRLRISIDATGKVLNIATDKSSGNRDLDRAAIEAAKTWVFNPGRQQGQPIGGDIMVPVNFQNPCPPVAPETNG